MAPEQEMIVQQAAPNRHTSMVGTSCLNAVLITNMALSLTL